MLDRIKFTISKQDFKRLQKTYHNRGKNSHVGKYGIEVGKLYLRSLGGQQIATEIDSVDLQAQLDGNTIKYEVKATADAKIAFSKLKVSSKVNHKMLIQGMEIMRICKIGQQTVDIYFLKYGKDFTLKEEPRWRLVKK